MVLDWNINCLPLVFFRINYLVIILYYELLNYWQTSNVYKYAKKKTDRSVAIIQQYLEYLILSDLCKVLLTPNKKRIAFTLSAERSQPVPDVELNVVLVGGQSDLLRSENDVLLIAGRYLRWGLVSPQTECLSVRHRRNEAVPSVLFIGLQIQLLLRVHCDFHVLAWFLLLLGQSHHEQIIRSVVDAFVESTIFH